MNRTIQTEVEWLHSFYSVSEASQGIGIDRPNAKLVELSSADTQRLRQIGYTLDALQDRVTELEHAAQVPVNG